MTPQEKHDEDQFILFLKQLGFTETEINDILKDESSSTFKFMLKQYEEAKEEPASATVPEPKQQADENPVAPDADGNCPEGWELDAGDGLCHLPSAEPASHGKPGELGNMIDAKLDAMVDSPDNKNEDGTLKNNKGDFLQMIANRSDRSVDTIQAIVSGDIGCPPPEVITAISSVVDIGVETLQSAADCGPPPEDETNKLKSLKNIKHSLKHKFSWPVALMLAPGEEEEFMLFKGVAMQSGEMKRGEIMTDDNIYFATGAMSTAAMMGVAMMDIDHYETAEEVPKSYLAKYGEGLTDPYPPAFIIDAAAEENVTEPDGKKHLQVEFIGACTNKLVYDMIKAGKFKGCSVVDYYRKEVCDDCQGTDGTCNCTIEGSHFLMNTFILEEVPNSNGTWVEVLTEKDVGTVIERPSPELVEALKLKANKDPRMRMKTVLLEQNKRRHAQYDLDKYMDISSGQWNDGKASISEFLTVEKGLPDVTAADMAEYLWTHPEALNQYQYENMSAEDLVAWFRHITEKDFKARFYQLQKQITALNQLSHNANGLEVLRNIEMLTQEEVSYGPGQEGTMCKDCRWFTATDAANIDGEGACAIVESPILGSDTCVRFEAIGEAVPPGEPEPSAEHPDPVEPNEDGSCDEGWELNEESNMCEKIAEPDAEHEPVEPDGDGNCPEGWVKTEIDGKEMCSMPEGVPQRLEQKLIKSARVFKLFRLNTKPTVKIEKKPQVKQSVVRKQYLERRDKIVKEINQIGTIMGINQESMAQTVKLSKLRSNLKVVNEILKKS